MQKNKTSLGKLVNNTATIKPIFIQKLNENGNFWYIHVNMTWNNLLHINATESCDVERHVTKTPEPTNQRPFCYRAIIIIICYAEGATIAHGYNNNSELKTTNTENIHNQLECKN